MQNRAFHLLGVRKGNVNPPSEYGLPLPPSHFLTIHPHCWDQSVRTETPGWFAQTWGQIGKWGCIGTRQGWPGKNWDQNQSWSLNSPIRSKILRIHRAPSTQAGRYKAKTAQCTGLGLSRITASFSKSMFLCSPTWNSTCNPRKFCFFYGVETPSPALLVCQVSAPMPTAEVLLFFSTVKTKELFYLRNCTWDHGVKMVFCQPFLISNGPFNSTSTSLHPWSHPGHIKGRFA